MTCEHGGNDVPAEFAPLFRGRRALVDSHRGYDPGALSLAHELAHALSATMFVSTVSRLVVELNRSPGRQFRNSPMMRDAPRELREKACARYYVPYRRDVEAFVAQATATHRRVVHVSSHTFTPSLDGTLRGADVGLLYDPSRLPERALCIRWQAALASFRTDWRVRRNYPYLGVSDGFTSYLRRRFDAARYVGVELEVNQKHVRNDVLPQAERAAIAGALREALASLA